MNSNELSAVPDPAVQPSTQTDTINNSVTNTPSDQDTSTGTIDRLAVTASDSVHLAKYKIAVAAALVNPDFTGDSKRVEKGTLAITLPNPEARVRAQLRANAEKKLYADAAKTAEKGNPFVPPTKEEIEQRIELGLIEWRRKQQ